MYVIFGGCFWSCFSVYGWFFLGFLRLFDWNSGEGKVDKVMLLGLWVYVVVFSGYVWSYF